MFWQCFLVVICCHVECWIIVIFNSRGITTDILLLNRRPLVFCTFLTYLCNLRYRISIVLMEQKISSINVTSAEILMMSNNRDPCFGGNKSSTVLPIISFLKKHQSSQKGPGASFWFCQIQHPRIFRLCFPFSLGIGFSNFQHRDRIFSCYLI